MRLIAVLLLCICSLGLRAQQNTATISGSILDYNDQPIAGVSITILGKHKGTASNDSGRFQINVTAQKSLALIFSHNGYAQVQRNFYLSPGETENIVVKMNPAGKTLDEVVITDKKEREETGLIKVNPKTAVIVPSTTGGVEAMIKTLVGSNNELSSQYNVRGGNYDENLVYINDFEVYRPYLVSSGQQEGLSLINAEMVRNVNFYTGGFAAKYGDKMSSVLDIQYKQPKKFGGSVYVSLLEQGLAIEGNTGKGKLSYLASVRNKNNRNLLSNQPTQGAYIPSASDAQAYITYRISPKLQWELLGIFSSSRFSFYPESVKKTSSVFSPLYTANLGLDVYFEGQEKDRYQTNLIGTSLLHSPNKKLKLKWMLSRFTDEEEENFDIAGAYIFGSRDFDNNSSTYGQIVNPLGAGYYQNYARNKLDIEIWNLSHKGSYSRGNHFFQWGQSVEKALINDALYQWEYQDSAGYSLPNNVGPLYLYNAINSSANLSVLKLSGYVQDNIHFSKKKNDISLQVGARYHYNDLNQQWLLSPRAQLSWKPLWKKDIVFKAAAGLYQQPPFYRELRRYDGSLNKNMLAQKSVQLVAGLDYQFEAGKNKPYRFTAEAYYKGMKDVAVYDIDNVKIRYLGHNDAKAYTAGLEMRLFGEFTPGAQSWLSVGFMRSRENLNNDFYYQYLNASGEIITPQSDDKVVADSLLNAVGWLRRPADRLFTLGLYMEDYLATNKNFKVHLNMLYGSNMSYNIPGSVRYRNGLVISPYMRIDMGFSALLLSEKSMRRSHNPFRGFDNIWLSFEVFNLIDRANTISYQLIKDFSNYSYAIPNRLTPRLVNLKLLARF